MNWLLVVLQNAVLTAAHCFEGVTASSAVVVAGEHDLDKADGTEQVVVVIFLPRTFIIKQAMFWCIFQRVAAAKIVINPDYDSNYLENDLAIIFTSFDFEINQ